MALLLASGLALVGCGGNSETGPGTGVRSDPVQIEALRVHHPQTLAFAAPFEFFDTGGRLEGSVGRIDRDVWASPDVLRSLLLNGESDVTAVPTYVGANLFQRGIDTRLAAVTVWGLLWLVGPEGTTPDWDSLRGTTISVPFPNDMPDLVFRRLARENGLVPGEDFEIEYAAQPTEIVARLVSGRADFAVLPEHVATVALAQAIQQGRDLVRVLDMQQEWADALGGAARIPQAGVVVPTSIAERPELLAGILDELEAAADRVNAAEPDTVRRLAEASGLPAPVVAQVIPRLNIEVVPAAEARQELERFYSELAALSPDIIGGELPDDEFYLQDPR
jgi:NitT/TauT family transport system substrate-binding protein